MQSTISPLLRNTGISKRCSLKQQILCYLFVIISSQLKGDGNSLVESKFINLCPNLSELCCISPALASPGFTPCSLIILNGINYHIQQNPPNFWFLHL